MDDTDIPKRSDSEPGILGELMWRSVVAQQWRPLGIDLVGEDLVRYKELHESLMNGGSNELLAQDPVRWRPPGHTQERA